MPSPINFNVRDAHLTDLSAVQAIQEYYVAETLMNFSYEPATLGEIQKQYDEVIAEGYPYLVAVRVNTSEPSLPNADPLLGYTFVHPFRARAAYQYTGELSIFCDPQHINQGVGGSLLEATVARLKEMKRSIVCIHSPKDPQLPRCSRTSPTSGATEREGAAHTDNRNKERDIHQLLACMTVDPNHEQAEKLRRFYSRHGFIETALLKKVGWKQGQWLDTRYMQLEL